MSQGHSEQVGLQVMNRVFSRFAHVIGFVCLSGAVLDLLGYQGLDLARPIWPALIPLVAACVTLLALDRWRTTLYCVLFLVVGGLSQYWFAVTLLTLVPDTRSLATPALSLVPIAVTLVAGSGFVPRAGVLWCSAGFVIGQLASIAAALRAGSPIRIDFMSISVEVGVVAVLATISVARRRRLAVRSDLERAVVDEELSALRYRIEVNAAALMHDMVLNHLTAIATSVDTSVTAELRRQIEKDLEALIGEEWLNDPSPDVDSQARQQWRDSSLLAAVQEARELSLQVEVTGDLAVVGRLTPQRDVAVGLAIKQCLVNVLRHAQVDHAEVVILDSETEVTVMVIDAGRGFSENLVAADRLGLRQSVRRRIESVGGEVQLWSTPGRGTSVMIRVPANERDMLHHTADSDDGND